MPRDRWPLEVWLSLPNSFGEGPRFVEHNFGSIKGWVASNRGVKHIVSVGAVLAALAWVCIPAAGQEVGRGESPPAMITRGTGNVRSNIVVIPLTTSNMTGWAWAPATRPELKVRPLWQAAPSGSPGAPLVIPPGVQGLVLSNRVLVPTAPAMVPPGVYETGPYSCIVVVPGPHADDCSIINPGGGGYSMPIGRPDLRFVPRAREKN